MAALTNPETVGYGRPGGENCGSGRTRPVDMAHLARQTMGDRALEQEVLGLFAQQAAGVKEQYAKSGQVDRLRMAHNLKGSARGVGAFPLADCIAELEQAPDSAALIRKLGRMIDEVRTFIAAISR